MTWFSFDAFPNFLHWRSQETGLTFDNIWLFGRFLLYQKFGEFNCSFIQNQCDKFYSHLGIAINVHLLVTKVW